jgi:preprotein translocase subunit YajC
VYFVRALRSGRTRTWGAFAAAVALGMYIHLTMLFVVMAQFAFYLWRVLRRKHEWPGKLGRLRPFMVGFVPSGLLTLLLYSPVLPQVLGAAESDVSDVATWRSAAWMIREIVGGLGLDPTLVGAGVAGLLVVAMGLWNYGRKEPVVVWLLIGSVALGGGITVALQHHLWPRFFLFAAGFGVLVVVRGLTVAAELAGAALRLRPKTRRHLATAFTLGMILVLGRSLPYVYRPKQDFGGARDFVVAAVQPGDTIVTTGVAASPYRLYYQPDWGSVTTLDDLRDVRSRASRAWLIYTLPIQLRDNQPDLLDVLESDFEIVDTFPGSLGGGAVFVVRGPGTASREDP